MTVAFALGGLTLGMFCLKTWQVVLAAKKIGRSSEGTSIDVTELNRMFQAHRNWGIRSYSQMIAPALYRYEYIAIHLLGVYRIPKPLDEGEYCDENDYCPAYARLLDAVHCWSYWISAWVVAEIIIFYLPGIDVGSRDHQMVSESVDVIVEEDGLDDATPLDVTTPLLSLCSDDGEKNKNDGPTMVDSKKKDNTDSLVDNKATIGSARMVNAISFLLAISTVLITGGLFF